MVLTVEIVDAPARFSVYGEITAVLQRKGKPPVLVQSPDRRWEVELELKDGRWAGKNVHYNSDGRRFIYFAWLSESGQMFRRIKLHQDQVVGNSARIRGTMMDGSPACATAQLVE